MSVAVKISPSVLDWVYSHIKDMDIFDKYAQSITQWKDGKKDPTFKQVESLSASSRIPLAYFFLDEPPHEEIPLLEYRTVDSLLLENPSRELIDTIRSMTEIQDWVRSFLIEEEYSQLEFVSSLKGELDKHATANRIRHVLDLEVNWYEQIKGSNHAFKFLRDAMSNNGVVVMLNGVVGNSTKRKLNIKEFRAFCLVDDYAPLIFINSCDSISGQLFSLLHEFVHICIGQNSLLNTDDLSAKNVNSLEVLCNAVAAEILVPISQFKESWAAFNELDVEQRVEKLSKIFNCSQIVIARRALDNSFISQKKYHEICDKCYENYELAQSKKSQSGGGDFFKTNARKMDHRFMDMLSYSYDVGRTQPTELMRLTNMKLDSFEKLVGKVRER